MLTYEQHLTSVTGGAARITWSIRTTMKCRITCSRRIIATAKAERGQVVEEPA
jgi:hypothetical protein